MPSKTKAFTLMEVMIVIVIISIIAAFGFPNYNKAVTKADEHNMIANLATMRSTLNFYLENGGAFVSWGNLTAINTNLGLSILDKQTVTYSCCASCNAPDGDAMTNGCVATHPKGWSLRFHEEHSSGGVHCADGTCPTCPAAPGRCG
ncbi:MAG TPA: prepilin-type N-terminal cleavage/methylation domain-containing protein [Candidatus Omnitrophota bacterium]|nr:prepilin-type N-terminal cleavage/methylation domain-containing protein [Candidatus Omnitrophota bacterium]